jgi:hypothetical protein
LPPQPLKEGLFHEVQQARRLFNKKAAHPATTANPIYGGEMPMR